MTHGEWFAFGAGFDVAAFLALMVGTATLYFGLDRQGASRGKRVALALHAMLPVFTLLLVASVVAFAMPYNIGWAIPGVLAILGPAAVNFAGDRVRRPLWNRQGQI
ncbi:hypothetical protein [Caulobacter sp. S45]|uniref:hypothetical protein n=1 Tax=Caulobacter sp. S45 TaxID=1641861 RepID=UPI00131A73AE|nr:hypothetical protein [Caulobacter sp. S45]